MKGYDSYKDSGVEWIGEIPKGWSVVRSKHYFENRVEKNNINEPLLSVTQNKSVVKREELEINVWNPDSDISGYKLIKKGDFVISLRTFEGGIELSEVQGIVSPVYSVLKVKKQINTRYFKHLFKSDRFIAELNKVTTGIRQGKNISYDDFSNINIPLPSITEQPLIGRYLDTKTSLIDSLIEKTQRKIELIKEKRTALINEVVTKGLNPNVEMKDSGVEWIGEIPKGWRIVPLRYLGSFQNGISKGSEFFGTGYPFMSYGDVYNNDVTPTELKGKVQLEDKELNRYSILRGDVFFTRTSETKDDIGVCSTCLTSIENSGFSGFVIRMRFHNNVHIPEYSKYHFQTHWKKVIIESKMNIVTRSSLSQQVLGDTPVLIPEIDEQKQIVEYLDEQTQLIDKTISIEERRIELLKEYRQSLISEVVTGKVKVLE